MSSIQANIDRSKKLGLFKVMLIKNLLGEGVNKVKNFIEQQEIGLFKRTKMPGMKLLDCRICGGETFSAVNLGYQPFANALEDQPRQDVKTYPLKMHVCKVCSTGQLSYCADSKELYENYLYVSPDSTALSAHFEEVADFLKENKYMDNSSNVLEIGSNIGHFLDFIKPHVNSIVGVDPAVNISKLANDRGLRTINDFFNISSAKEIFKKEGKKDLIIARHCFAHNEKPQLMLEGVTELLSDEGAFIIENAYFLDTVNHCEVDQIYHEHMYFYNLRAISEMVEQHGLVLVDIHLSSIHGGTMLYVVKSKSSNYSVNERVLNQLDREKDMHTEEFYQNFIAKIENNREEIQQLIKTLLSEGKTIHGYGASAKSTMLLNYYQINSDIMPVCADSTTIKQGKYIPKVNIKVIDEEEAAQNPPDYYLLTSWNYKDEIIKKVRNLGNKKSQFILPHPEVQIIK